MSEHLSSQRHFSSLMNYHHIKNQNVLFMKLLDSHFKGSDRDQILKAYRLAEDAHGDQRRRDHSKYFSHPQGGSIMLMNELGIYDKDIIISFLLHDVVEDTDYFASKEKKNDFKKYIAQARAIARTRFNSDIANVVSLLSKPKPIKGENGDINFPDESECDQYIYDRLSGKVKCSNEKQRRMAIFLKMIDRLHNLRTWKVNRENMERTQKQIIETEEIYLPLFESIREEHKYKKYFLPPFSLLKKVESRLNELKKDITSHHRVS